MNRITVIFILWAAAAAGAGAADAAKGAANGRAVLPPARRAEALKVADRVLTPRAPTWRNAGEQLPDPFFRSNFARDEEKVPEIKPNEPRLERSDLEVLTAAANSQVNPTGTMMVDGENYLLLGGKRYKTGAQLPVTLDGIVYTIVISAIDGKSYTLRLNQEELTRQLK